VKFLVNIHLKALRIGRLSVWFFGLTACVQADPGTRADREALCDVIVAKIMARGVFADQESTTGAVLPKEPGSSPRCVHRCEHR
jgi:hypothetical protein